MRRFAADPTRDLEPHRRVGGYAEYAPPGDLTPFVRCLWAYHAPPDGGRAGHRLLPHSGVSLCIRFSRACGGGAEPEVLFVGPVHRPAMFEPDPGLILEAVELRPEWCRAVLQVAPEEHVGGLRPWGELDGDGPTAEVRSAVRSSGTGLPELVSWVRSRCAESRPDAVTRLAHAALLHLGVVSGTTVVAAADTLGVSTRHLRRVVREVVGSSPKYLQRLLRFNRAVRQADGAGEPAWAAVAAGHGFYDQAHLIQEFRELAGVTPTVLHAERRAEPVPFFQSPFRTSP